MKNQNIFTYNNVQDSIPKATLGVGGITSQNNNLIIGIGTAFLTAVNIGDYIYIKAQNDFRKIEQIMSDTELVIETAFDIALVGAGYHVTPSPRYAKIELMVTGANDAVIDGETFEQGEVLEFSKKDKSKTASGDYILPIDVDANTNNTIVKITVNY